MEVFDIGRGVNASLIVARAKAIAIFAGLREMQLIIEAYAKVNNKEAFEAVFLSNLIGQIPVSMNDAYFKERFDPIDAFIVVLHHEIFLYHSLIVFMNPSLKATLADMKGTIVIDETFEKMARSIVGNRLPETRRSLAFPSGLTLRSSWMLGSSNDHLSVSSSAILSSEANLHCSPSELCMEEWCIFQYTQVDNNTKTSD
jgi:hypothetical protein